MKRTWAIEVAQISTWEMLLRIAAQELRINLLVSVTTMALEINPGESKIEVMVVELDQGQPLIGVRQISYQKLV